MRRLKGAVAFLVVLGVTVALWPEHSEPVRFRAPELAPVALLPERSEPATEAALPGAPEISAAATVDLRRELRLHVTFNGQTAVGRRIQFTCGAEPVSGLVDIMGWLTLPVVEGASCVMTTDGMRDELIVVTQQPTYELVLKRRLTVSGRVVDVHGKPVPGAGVVLMPDTSRTAGPNGTFSLEAKVEPGVLVHLMASTDDGRSIMHTVAPPAADLQLVVETRRSFTVIARGPGANSATLEVRPSDGLWTICTSTCRVQVIPGEVRSTAVDVSTGRLMSASAVDLVSATGPTKRVLTLAPTPPLTGRVVDVSGQPVVALTLELSAVAHTLELFLEGSADPTRPLGAPQTTSTDLEGRFTVEWPAAVAATVFELKALGPRQLERRVLTVPGDAPLELVTRPPRH